MSVCLSVGADSCPANKCFWFDIGFPYLAHGCITMRRCVAHNRDPNNLMNRDQFRVFKGTVNAYLVSELLRMLEWLPAWAFLHTSSNKVWLFPSDMEGWGLLLSVYFPCLLSLSISIASLSLMWWSWKWDDFGCGHDDITCCNLSWNGLGRCFINKQRLTADHSKSEKKECK